MIGLYGLPRSGKSFLLNILRRGLSNAEFSVAAGTSGGLEAFQKRCEYKKQAACDRATWKVKQETPNSGNSAIITRHAVFWA